MKVLKKPLPDGKKSEFRLIRGVKAKIINSNIYGKKSHKESK
jgi:hypothetical protein